MATTVRLLNLDSSLPSPDDYYNTSAAQAGVIRFLNASDPQKLPAFNRLQGDLVNRFILIESKINEIIVAAANGEFSSDTFDGGLYSRIDGSTPFTAPVKGIDPILPEHLATKDYVDDLVQTLNTSLTEFSEVLDTINETSVHYSAWTTHTWQATVKQIVSLTISPVVTDVNKIVGINLLERVNVAIPTVGNPSPSPRFIVRHLTIDTKSPFGVDDMWFENNTVKVAIPNTAFYAFGYDKSYQSVQSVSFRQLRAVVTLIK